jgi:hypothetical protein
MVPWLFLLGKAWVASHLISKIRWRIIRKKGRHLHVSINGDVCLNESMEVILEANDGGLGCGDPKRDRDGKWRNREWVREHATLRGRKDWMSQIRIGIEQSDGNR